MRFVAFIPTFLSCALISGSLLAQSAPANTAVFPDVSSDVTSEPQPEGDSVAAEQQGNSATPDAPDAPDAPVVLPPPPAEPATADSTRTSPEVQATTAPQASAATPDRQTQARVLWSNSGPDDPTDDRESSHDEKIGKRWYGWQTLLVDGGNVLVAGLLASGGDTSATASMFVGGYALGGPIVHLAHKNWGSAFASLGLRAGLPTAGAFIGASTREQCGHDMCLGEAAVGMLIGMATAIALDSALLAYETKQHEGKSPQRWTSKLNVSPMLNAERAPVGLQVAGAF